jgi:hypothetical protein
MQSCGFSLKIYIKTVVFNLVDPQNHTTSLELTFHKSIDYRSANATFGIRLEPFLTTLCCRCRRRCEC